MRDGGNEGGLHFVDIFDFSDVVENRYCAESLTGFIVYRSGLHLECVHVFRSTRLSNSDLIGDFNI